MNRRSASRIFLRRSLAVAACSGIATIGSHSSAATPPSNGTNINLSEKVSSCIRSISREQSKAVVRIRCSDSHGEINGTGFYVDPSGLICTLGEMIRGADHVSVQQEGDWHPATVVALDPRSGVAFLKSQATNTPSGAASFLNPSSITNAPAQTPVIGIGFPRDAAPATSLGMITGTGTHVGEYFFCVPHLLAGIPLAEGEGGAPVVDLSGGLVGMVISGDRQTGSCWILPAAAIQKLHHDLLCRGRLNPGWIGAVVEEAAVPQGNSRARVASVQQGSPAQVAGILPGDMILSIAGHPVTNPEEVPGASFYLTGGEKVELKFIRKGELKKINVTCGEPVETIGNLGSTSTTPLDPGMATR
jgi:S1-C subfamily serine protease